MTTDIKADIPDTVAKGTIVYLSDGGTNDVIIETTRSNSDPDGIWHGICQDTGEHIRVYGHMCTEIIVVAENVNRHLYFEDSSAMPPWMTPEWDWPPIASFI
ncbi:MAG: hypothetical protein KDI55_00220 [Anaerolineae bacterium]|nr:hypothetical protein [Anaerolineae bacterium]